MDLKLEFEAVEVGCDLCLLWVEVGVVEQIGDAEGVADLKVLLPLFETCQLLDQ